MESGGKKLSFTLDTFTRNIYLQNPCRNKNVDDYNYLQEKE